MWWEEQSIETKQKFKHLINSGQLDFAAGGWSMNDEATSYYEDIIDVFTGGHTYLYEQLGVIPKVGWQIDPFGHSSTHAYISYMMGMDGQYFARIDQLDKAQRLIDKNLEFIWNPKPGVELFCHINYHHYSSPAGFDFDPLRSAPKVQDSQIPSRSQQLLDYFESQANYYKGDLLMHTLGDDNEWSSADIYYENIEKVMNFINNQANKSKIHFATPYSYLKFLNQQELTYTTKSDDFFPYSDDPKSYWTGYFTSRVGFKGFARQLGKEYQQIKTFISKQISYGNIKDEFEVLQVLNLHGQNLGIAQHHDAITGTAKQFVNDDYIRLLMESQNSVSQYLRKHLSILAKEQLESDYEFYTYYHNSTSKECKELYQWLEERKTVLMALVMNSNQLVKIAVPNLSYRVIDQNNILQKSELLCSELDQCILYILLNSEYDIEYFKIIPSDSKEQHNQYSIVTNITDYTLISLDNGPEFKLSYHYYTPSSDSRQPSGAYIFRPEGNINKYGEITNCSIYNGTLLTELIINRTKIITKIRKYKHLENEYEIETFIDSIDFTNNKGREIIMLVDTDIKNEETFYTDSNGLDLQERKKNYRETFNLINSEPISSNYYPVTNMIVLQQQDGKSVALINDRSQGGTSLREGQLELMIHRRIGTDDKRGVGEALREDDVDPYCHRAGTCSQKGGLTQTVVHHLVFYNKNQNPNAARKVQVREDLVALKYFAEDTSSKFSLNHNQIFKQSYLDEIEIDDESALVKIRIEPTAKYFLLRVHNLQEIGSFEILLPESVKIYETTMNGLQTIEDWKNSKLNWQATKETTKLFENSKQISPQYIRTFVIIR